MKGSAITGPVGKEAAELWPVRTPRCPPNHPTEANTPSSVLPATRVLSCKGCLENRKGTKESEGSLRRDGSGFKRGVHSGLGLGKAFFHEMETSFYLSHVSVLRNNMGIAVLGFDGGSLVKCREVLKV